MSKLVRGSVINFAFKLIGMLVGFTITVITARIGTEARGEYSIFILIAQVYITFFAGASAAIAYRVSRLNEKPEPILSTSLIMSVVIGIIFSLACIITSDLIVASPYSNLWVLGISAPFLLVVPYMSGLYLATGNMVRLNVNNNFTSILFLTILLTIIFYNQSPPSLMLVLFAWCISQIIGAIFSLFYYKRFYSFTRPDKKILPPLIKFSKDIGLTNLIGILNYRADLFLVQAFLGLSSAGVYSIAVSLSEILWFISSSVTNAAYGRIGEEEATKSSHFVIRIIHLNLILLLIAVPILLLLVIIGVPYIFGDTYKDSILPLLILLPGILLYGAASTISAFFTNQLGRADLPKKIAGFSLFVNLTGSLILIPRIGLQGAAISSTLSYILSMFLSFSIFIKYSDATPYRLFVPDIKQISSDIFKLFSIFRIRK